MSAYVTIWSEAQRWLDTWITRVGGGAGRNASWVHTKLESEDEARIAETSTTLPTSARCKDPRAEININYEPL
jgi:hypothetical protein